MANATYRITRSNDEYRAEARSRENTLHIAEGLASEADARCWIETYQRLANAPTYDDRSHS
jgi:hypothetical protein